MAERNFNEVIEAPFIFPAALVNGPPRELILEIVKQLEFRLKEYGNRINNLVVDDQDGRIFAALGSTTQGLSADQVRSVALEVVTALPSGQPVSSIQEALQRSIVGL